MKRTVEIICGDIQLVNQRTLGKVQEALGYFSTWAFDRVDYAFVRIVVDETDCEVVANYSTGVEDQSTFTMVGLWRPREQSYMLGVAIK